MDEKNDQSTEQAILEAAERLFLEKGFAQTSTTEIAKAVGCNQALVHYYFRTKDNLFNTIFEKKFRSFFQQIFNVNFSEDMPFLDKIRKMVEVHFDLLYENPRIPGLIMNELSRQPDQLKILKDKLHEIPEQLFEQLSKGLQIEIAAGRVRDINPIDLIITVVSINVALFTIFPIASKVINFNEEQLKMMLYHRREENVKVVLGYLRP
ncbi:MAG TPA: TetR/AcrR family transcriptional regulator [Prolixibacteraceae bacterium]|nr:TetR/AcrR family transcriptional regulator [Prolixibacteraceae bacterium]